MIIMLIVFCLSQIKAKNFEKDFKLYKTESLFYKEFE